MHPQAVNREDSAEPPAARVPEPAGFHATALWLRSSFSDLVLAVQEVVAEDDLIVAHVTMWGRQTGDVAITPSLRSGDPQGASLCAEGFGLAAR